MVCSTSAGFLASVIRLVSELPYPELRKIEKVCEKVWPWLPLEVAG